MENFLRYLEDLWQAGGGRGGQHSGDGGGHTDWGWENGYEGEDVLSVPVGDFGEAYATGVHSPSMAQAHLFRTSCPEIAACWTGH